MSLNWTEVEVDDLTQVIGDDLTAAGRQRAVMEDGSAVLLVAWLRRLDVEVDDGSPSFIRRYVDDQKDVASAGRKVHIHVQFLLMVIQCCRVIRHLYTND